MHSSTADGEHFEGTFEIVTIFALEDTACTDIATIDDGVATGVLELGVKITISDTHVIIPPGDGMATVQIEPSKMDNYKNSDIQSSSRDPS